MRVTFHGVRGSFPCPSSRNGRYGGNTACVSLTVDGEPPILLDLGTGLPFFDHRAARGDRPFRGTALVTHLHFDHVLGLPFFEPLVDPAAILDVYAPAPPGQSLHDALAALIGPPYFPVALDDLPAELRFHEMGAGRFEVGAATVTGRPVPHTGRTVGYRVEWDGATVAYVSDHQAPPGLDDVDSGVLELCEGVDLLIHEAQYTRDEFAAKPRWGHGTPDYAALVAQKAGAGRLCLFHHDPWRTDDALDALVADTQRTCAGTGVAEVTAAAEGVAIEL